jgi:glycine/D-amino acid oxidase-like deaminating enzyme
LWTALEIKNKHPKAKITIIEKGTIPTGASTRNAGFACFGSPSEMLHDVAFIGEDKMWSIVEMRYKGITKIRKHFKDKQISYDSCGGYECFKIGTHDLEDTRNNLSWLNRGLKKITGKKNSFQFCDNKLKKYNLSGFESMVENKNEGGLHSGKLVSALIKRVQSAGVQILYGIEITGWEDVGNKVSIQTNKRNLEAKKLVLCTNALSAKLLPECNLKPVRGQVMVTAPINGLKLKGTFHFDQGFYYFRNIDNRVLLGGARNTAFEQEETADMFVTDNIQQKLEQFLSDHILNGTPYKITHRWSGIMGLTRSRLPLVEAVGKNITAALACNGMGVALSPIIAEEIAEVAIG